jgi:hypothetical protein
MLSGQVSLRNNSNDDVAKSVFRWFAVRESSLTFFEVALSSLIWLRDVRKDVGPGEVITHDGSNDRSPSLTLRAKKTEAGFTVFVRE